MINMPLASVLNSKNDKMAIYLGWGSDDGGMVGGCTCEGVSGTGISHLLTLDSIGFWFCVPVPTTAEKIMQRTTRPVIKPHVICSISSTCCLAPIN
jgi:hypothetical protein